MKFSKELVTTYDGEVINVPEEEILRLKVGEAWCKMGRHAFRMNTYLATGEGSSKRAEWIIGRSRMNYGMPPMASAAASLAAGTTPSQIDQALEDLDPGNVFGEA